MGHIARFCKSPKVAKGKVASANITEVTEEAKPADAAQNAPAAAAHVVEEVLNSAETAEALQTCSRGDSIVDSACTRVMTADKTWLICPGPTTLRVRMANNVIINAEAEGDLVLRLPAGILKTRIYYLPTLVGNLLSVGAMTHAGYDVFFRHVIPPALGSNCIISLKDTVLAVANALPHSLWRLGVDNAMAADVIADEATASLAQTSISTWHARMAHMSKKRLQKLAKHVKTDIALKETEWGVCEPCVMGKMARKPFPSSNTVIEKFLELVVSDLGHMSRPTYDGYVHFITILDIHSRYLWIELLRLKSDACQAIQTWYRLIKNTKEAAGLSLRVFRSDGGGEYVNAESELFLSNEGIKFQTTAPHTPQHNAYAELRNRTIVEPMRALLHATDLGWGFWGEALRTVVHVQNKSPTRGLKDEMTPYEALKGKKPSIDHFRVWGCVCYMHIPDKLRKKLDAKAIKGRFMGYEDGMKAYRIWDFEARKIRISRDVIFDESCLSLGNEREKSDLIINWGNDESANNNESEASLDEFVDDWYDSGGNQGENGSPRGDESLRGYESPLGDEDFDEIKEIGKSQESGSLGRNTSSHLPQRRSERGRIPNKQFDAYDWGDMADWDMIAAVAEKGVKPLIGQIPDPNTYEEAMASPDAAKWEEAIMDELKSLVEMETSEFVELPPDRKAISCKYVFKKKQNEKGELAKYKARLVARGFSQ